MQRFKTAARRLRMVKQLANPGLYEWTDEQVEELVGKLQAEVDGIAAAFAAARKGRKPDEPDIEL